MPKIQAHKLALFSDSICFFKDVKQKIHKSASRATPVAVSNANRDMSRENCHQHTSTVDTLVVLKLNFVPIPL